MSDQALLRTWFLIFAIAVALIGLRAHNVITWPWAVVLVPISLVGLSLVSALVFALLERRVR